MNNPDTSPHIIKLKFGRQKIRSSYAGFDCPNPYVARITFKFAYFHVSILLSLSQLKRTAKWEMLTYVVSLPWSISSKIGLWFLPHSSSSTEYNRKKYEHWRIKWLLFLCFAFHQLKPQWSPLFRLSSGPGFKIFISNQYYHNPTAGVRKYLWSGLHKDCCESEYRGLGKQVFTMRRVNKTSGQNAGLNVGVTKNWKCYVDKKYGERPWINTLWSRNSFNKHSSPLFTKTESENNTDGMVSVYKCTAACAFCTNVCTSQLGDARNQVATKLENICKHIEEQELFWLL